MCSTPYLIGSKNYGEKKGGAARLPLLPQHKLNHNAAVTWSRGGILLRAKDGEGHNPILANLPYGIG